MIDRLRDVKATLRGRYRNWRGGLSENQFGRVRAGLIVAVLLVLGSTAYAAARPSWRAWRHKQAMSQAFEYAERQDYRNTMLALRRATELAPMDLATWRAVSEKLAELGSPQAVAARENVVRLDPTDMSMRLALVSDALRFGQVEVAHDNLEGVEGATRRAVEFQRLAVAVAVATGDARELEKSLEALVSADSEDAVARFNLAAIQVWSADTTKQTVALRELEELTRLRTLRVRAGIELLKHAAQIRDANRARFVVNLLLDRMGVATGLRMSFDQSPQGWTALIQGFQDTAEYTGPDDVGLVARWMGDIRMGKEAMAWIDRLPAAVRDAAPVLRANATLSAAAEDHARLPPLLRAGAMGELPEEAILLASAARWQRTRYQDSRGLATWDDAIAACGKSASALTALARLADAWRDTDGSEAVLQALLKQQPRLNWAYVALRNIHTAKADMPRLWQLYGAWSSAMPDKPELVRSWLKLGILLDRVSPESATMAVRRAEAAGAEPADIALGAGAQWRRKQQKAAVALIDRLPIESRERPEIVYWRAVVLADSQDRLAEARTALALVKREAVSAEEEAILAKVEKQVRGKSGS